MDSDILSPQRVDQHLLLRSVFGALAVIAGAFLVSNVAAAVVYVATGVESLDALGGQPVLYTVLNAAASTGFLVAAVGYLAIRDEWEILHFREPTVRDVAFVVGGLVVLGIANVGTSILISAILAALESLFGITAEFGQNTVVTTAQRNPVIFLYLIPVSLFIVGPGEELVFRGVVQGLFRRVVGVVPAILIASLLFGIGHYLAISSGSAWTYIFATATLGIVLGAVYEYTESIVVPAAIHGLYNAGLFAINWISIAYGVSMPT